MGITGGEERKEQSNIGGNNDWECPQINVRLLPDPGISENTKQVNANKQKHKQENYTQAYHFQTIENQRLNKQTNKLLKEARGNNALPTEQERQELYLTAPGKAFKQEESGVKYLALIERNPPT